MMRDDRTDVVYDEESESVRRALNAHRAPRTLAGDRVGLNDVKLALEQHDVNNMRGNA